MGFFARGVIAGLSGSTRRGAIYRALLEGIALEIASQTNEVAAVTGGEIAQFVAIGGGSDSNLWLQILADASGRPVHRSTMREASSLGAAIAAAKGAGWYETIAEAAAAMVSPPVRTFQPEPKNVARYAELRAIHAELWPRLRRLERAPRVLHRRRDGMKPIASFPEEAASRIVCILTDVDDTLTTGGRLSAASYTALEKLHGAGIAVVPVTGRPAGWCDMIARFWPVAGVIGENGAFYFRHDPVAHRMVRKFIATDAERAANRRRLVALGERILAEVPGSAISADQLYREADLAIDFCEDVPPLPHAAVEKIVAMFESAGGVAKISSIHVNGWFSGYEQAFHDPHLLARQAGSRARPCQGPRRVLRRQPQ